MNESQIRKTLPCIRLLTLSYPYSAAAEANFLEPELKVLTQTFRVVVVPRRIDGELQVVPPGVEVDLSLASMIMQHGGLRASKVLALIQRTFLAEVYRQLPLSLNRKRLEEIFASYYMGRLAVSWYKKLNAEPAGPHIVYGWWLTPEILNIATVASRRGDIAIARAHRGDLYAPENGLKEQPFVRQLLGNLDLLCPISNHGLDFVSKEFLDITCRSAVHHLGTEDFGLAPATSSNPKELRIMSCSFVSPIKQLDLAITGVKEFAKKHSEIKITWFHFGDGSEKEEFWARASSFEEFKFIGNAFPGPQGLRNFYKENPIDCFLNTSRSEGIPVTMIEAASFGIPLVGPDVGGVPEIALHKQNGYVMTLPVSAQKVVQALEHVSGLDPEEVISYRTKSRQVWLKDFSSPRVYNLFVKDILSLRESKGLPS